MVYRISCKKCKSDKGKIADYWGETARTAFLRGKEHLDGLHGKDEKNSLWKHSEQHHEGSLERGDFRMEVMEKHRSALTRQVQEGVELEMNMADLIMNSKSEWNYSRIPRIFVELGEEIEVDKESGMEKSRKKVRGKELRKITSVEAKKRRLEIQSDEVVED